MSGFTFASGQASTTVSLVCPVCQARREVTPQEAQWWADALWMPSAVLFCSPAHAADLAFHTRMEPLRKERWAQRQAEAGVLAPRP